MNEPTGIEQLLARDRLIISVAMLAIFLIAAVYTVMGGWYVNVFSGDDIWHQ